MPGTGFLVVDRAALSAEAARPTVLLSGGSPDAAPALDGSRLSRR
ncbi:hypothetical protein [Streptomyces poriticola]